MVRSPPEQNPRSPHDAAAGDDRLAAIRTQLAAQRYPPVHRFAPAHCGEIDIRISRDGRWYYRGTPIERPEMVRLFASVLRREGSRHYLVTPVEKLEIMVEDAPYVAVEMSRFGRGSAQTLAFRLQTDEIVIADPDHPIRIETDPETGSPRPYIRVRDALDALIARPVYYELADLATPAADDPGRLGVRSAGAFFPLGRIDEED